jgi:hypothetical protein
MTFAYERELGRELAVVGISGRLRARILDEFADHLACDPGADLGDPRELACQFADQLGSARAMTAAVGSFAALMVAGLVFAVAFAFSGSAAFGAVRGAPRRSAASPPRSPCWPRSCRSSPASSPRCAGFAGAGPRRCPPPRRG